MVPAMRMRCGGLGARQIAVAESKQRAAAVRDQLVLDCGRAGRDRTSALRLPTPGVHEPSRWIDLDGLAARDVAIATSRWTEMLSVTASMLVSLLLFRLALECFEPFVPEFFEERLQLSQAFRSRSIQAPCAVPPLAHEPGLLQDVQVLGDRGPRHVEVRGNLARRELTVTDEPQDLAPTRLRERLQACFHPYS